MLTALPRLDHLPQLVNHKSLDGSQGINREKTRRCQINANNDYEAVQCWLNEYRTKPTTFRSYQKEAERFLLWAVFQKQKPLSSIEREDLEAYFDFLDDPQPKEQWCVTARGRNAKRGQSDWKPFVGPLKYSAKMTAISILDSLFGYLVDACYLSFNPLSLMRRRKRHQLQQSTLNLIERILSPDEWHAMLDVMENLAAQTQEEKQEKARLIFLINILFFLGIRINELATHTWNAFRKIEESWWFYVFGKGDKVGRIPVNDELIRAMIHYRLFLKKSPLPDRHDETPLIASFKTGKAITPRQINKILKKLALKTSQQFKDHPEKANKLKKFSAHWLRHLSASMQDKAGIAFKHIRANHRHENDETTRRYVHAIDGDRHTDMQKLKLREES